MRSKLSILLIYFLFIGKGFTQEEVSMSQNLTYISTGMSLQMMRLEKQELSEEEKTKAMKGMVLDIIEAMPKSLWDEQ